MAQNDRLLAQAFGTGGINIIRLHHFQQAGARHTGNAACAVPAQGNGGQNHGKEGTIQRKRECLDFEGKQVLQQQRHHENRHGNASQRNAHEQVVHKAVLPDGCYNTGAKAQHPGKQRRQQGEFQRVGERLYDHIGNSAVIFITDAQVPMDRPGQIVKELHDHRLIQPHHFSQAVNGGLVHMFTQQHSRRIAGNNAQHDEDEQYHADQHRNGAQNALYHAFHTESLPFCPSQPLFPNCQSVKTMLCAGEHHFPRRRCFGTALL